jgi:hypothetical protein
MSSEEVKPVEPTSEVVVAAKKEKKEKKEKPAVAAGTEEDATPVANVNMPYVAYRIALWDKIKAEQATVEHTGTLLCFSRGCFATALFFFFSPQHFCVAID